MTMGNDSTFGWSSPNLAHLIFNKHKGIIFLQGYKIMWEIRERGRSADAAKVVKGWAWEVPTGGLRRQFG